MGIRCLNIYSNLGAFDVEGYYIWDLQKYIEEFILKQLVKRGLSIEERTVKTKRRYDGD